LFTNLGIIGKQHSNGTHRDISYTYQFLPFLQLTSNALLFIYFSVHDKNVVEQRVEFCEVESETKKGGKGELTLFTVACMVLI
jgi:hypothetical protein